MWLCVAASRLNATGRVNVVQQAWGEAGGGKRGGSYMAEPNPPRASQRWPVSHKPHCGCVGQPQAVERVTIEWELWRTRAVPGSRDEPMSIDQAVAAVAATRGPEVRRAYQRATAHGIRCTAEQEAAYGALQLL